MRSLTGLSRNEDPVGPGDTPSRRRIFTSRPAEPASARVCATEILSALARRAYRLVQQEMGAPGSIPVDHILDGVARYRATPDGLVPWRERPEHFRKNCIARIPPREAPE